MFLSQLLVFSFQALKFLINLLNVLLLSSYQLESDVACKKTYHESTSNNKELIEGEPSKVREVRQV